jgi:hypothetical protein
LLSAVPGIWRKIWKTQKMRNAQFRMCG